MITTHHLQIFVFTGLILVSAVSCDTGEIARDHIIKNENGEDFDLTGFWINVQLETNQKTGDTCVIGDIGIGLQLTDENLDVDFSYELVESYQLPGGKWMNNFNLVVKNSEVDLFVAGKTYYATVFAWGSNDGDGGFNIVIDEALPYKTEGADYPNGSFPLFRKFI